MIVNFSLLFLNIYQISHSPIVSFSSTTFSTTRKLENLAVKKIFNNFYYENVRKHQKNFLTIKRSLFTNTLSTAIYITSEDFWRNSSFHFTQQTVLNLSGSWIIEIDNCCFDSCKTTQTQTDGGAIATLMQTATLTLTSCILKNCVAQKWGGAVLCGCQNFVLDSDIFAGCHAVSGMAFFFNHKKMGVTYWGSFMTIDRVGFFNNKGKHDVTDMNVTRIFCLYSNFSNNINEESNIPTSQAQYCCAFSMLAFDNGQDYRFLNFIANKGDFLIDFNEKPTDCKIMYINLIGNYGLNYFFRVDTSYPTSSSYIYLSYFNFFENKANVDPLGIFIANAGTPIKFYLQNCVFDFSYSMLSSILNGHYEYGSNCDQSLSQAGTHTIQQVLIKPSICSVDTGFTIQGSPPSSEFSASMEFSCSYDFSKSGIFSPSTLFTYSSKFTSSLYFSSSSHFSSSSTFSPSTSFTPSTAFTSSKAFTLSTSFTPSIFFTSSASFTPSTAFTSQTSFTHSISILSSSISLFSSSGTFTPSSQFTPSFSFSPNRTKVPDPMNIHNHVTGKQKIFTKEEIKKAAAPASISLTLIIVGVVMMILYLRRKIKLIKDQSIPDFDSSLNDETESESEYSYSYYTFTYTYTYCSEALSETTDREREREVEFDEYYNEETDPETEYSYSDFTYGDESNQH